MSPDARTPEEPARGAEAAEAAEGRKPPPFFCPACGQKHRARRDSLPSGPGAVLRTRCAGCGLDLLVSLAADGTLGCERAAEAAAGPTAAAVAQPPAPPAEVAAATAPAEAEDLTAGALVGRYAIEEAVGAGATSRVYRAFDPTTNRTVALKVLGPSQTETGRRRFLREIEVQANLRHPNVMPVFDRGELPDGRPYFTMELLHRPLTLTEIVRRREDGTLGRYASLKPLQELERLLAEVFVPVCDGIYVANVEGGVVHRDLKPDNVLVDSRTLRPYVIDWGLCHVLPRKGAEAPVGAGPAAEESGIVGTPRFLAPEQARGGVNARTDVWGLGALLHYVLAGDAPIAAATGISRAELARRVQALTAARAEAEREGAGARLELIDEKLARLKDPGLRTLDDMFQDARQGRYQPLPATAPPALAAVVRKAMAPTPAERYVNARQLLTEVQAFLRGRRVRALSEQGGAAAVVAGARRALRRHRATLVWGAAGLVLGLALGAALAGDTPPVPSTRVAGAVDELQALLDQRLPRLMALAPALRPAEARRAWRDLSAALDGLEAGLRDEPDTPDVAAVRERLAFVRRRFAPPRVAIEVAAGSRLELHDLDGEPAAAREVEPGEVALAPGRYEVRVDGGAIRFPLAIPLVIRPNDRDPDREPPLLTVRVPLRAAQVPAGMALVPGGRVRVRERPFAEPSAAPTEVVPFLIDRAEVSHAEYAAFLADLGPAERAERTPPTGFRAAEDGAGPPRPEAGLDAVPVVGVRAEDARAYAAWRAGREGARVRLPTEAEWVLAAGALLGDDLPGGAHAGPDLLAELEPPLKAAGQGAVDRAPYGVLGLLGNAREWVLPSEGGLGEGVLLVKGAGVGDEPDEGAIYRLRPLEAGARHPTTGFRCVRELE